MNLASVKISSRLQIKFCWVRNLFTYQTTYEKTVQRYSFVFHDEFYQKTENDTVIDKNYSNGPLDLKELNGIIQRINVQISDEKTSESNSIFLSNFFEFRKFWTIKSIRLLFNLKNQKLNSS